MIRIPVALPAWFLNRLLAAGCLVGAAVLPCAGAAPAPPAEEILPPPGQGITPVGEPIVYAGEALYNYINGGAPHVLEYGFHEVASQELLLNDRTYIMDVYRLADAVSAFGLFSTRSPQGAPLIGEYPHSSLTVFQGLAAHGPYLFDISAYDPGPWVAAEMAALIDRATARLPNEHKARGLLTSFPLGYLPIAGRQAGTEKLARGPVGLRAALGRSARGDFLGLLEKVQLFLASGDIAARQKQRQRSPAGEEAGTKSHGSTGLHDCWWVLAGYHPHLDELDQLQPQTVLVMLLGPGDLTPVRQAVESAARGFDGDRTACGGLIWKEDGGTGYFTGQADRLFFVRSSLPPATLQAWTATLLAP